MRTLILLLLSMPLLCGAQVLQNLRGTIVDSESQFPIPGVTVELLSDSGRITVTDLSGNYNFNWVPVGRHSLRFSFIGFQERQVDNVVINSGKATVLNITLQEMIMEMGAADIQATRDGEARNDMATVSARQFDVVETDKYAGSRGDPARMASNFAGVQGADDSRNDIVIRGNSPQGVLWRVEGVDLPNPNHFAIPGTGGGPVAILNNKTLANSDFFTGAFPAEYGNSIAGVFDLRLRNGNNRDHEFSGQFGFLGTELLAEGPLNKESGSSYLANFRYSTLSLFSNLNIDIGTSAVPLYSDGFFRFNFPKKNGSQLAVWGLGGASSVDIVISDQKQPERNIFGENDRDQYFRTRMGIVGLTSSRAYNDQLFVKQTLSISHDWQGSHHDLVYRHLDSSNFYVNDSLNRLLEYDFEQNKISWSLYANRKFTKNLSAKAGFLVDGFSWKNNDRIRNLDSASVDFLGWSERWGSTASALLIQPYIQGKWRPDDQWTFVAGLHSQFFTLNNSASWIEPRLGIKREFKNGQALGLGLGRHSQTQSSYLYFYQPTTDANGTPIQHNRNMGFTISDHLVLSYDRLLGKSMRTKVETYYQSVSNVPVEVRSSSFSLLNTGAGFSRFFPDSLQNTGTGSNYGLEVTLEKFFNNSYFFMITTSLFSSEYKGSDGVSRNTDFNGGYALNVLASKEWPLDNKVSPWWSTRTGSLVAGFKFTMAGGRWYGPVDIDASNELREIVYVDAERNTLQFDDYLRLDVKINYKINRPRLTHEVGLDLVNVTGRKNVLKLTYAPDENEDPEKSIREEYQLGFFPVFFFRIDF